MAVNAPLRSKVWFSHRGVEVNAMLPEGRGVVSIKDGFWCDGDLNPTFESHAVYWIPPSQILYVEKVRVSGAKRGK